MKLDSGPNALRRGRHSAAGRCYFVTVNVQPRVPVLRGEVAEKVHHAFHALDAALIWRLRCSTVMPDHVHLFFELGECLTLSQSIARLKHDTKPVLQSVDADWQQNFYDHLLAVDEPVGPVIRYIFMNPYAAGLISPGEAWPFFHCGAADWAWFRELTNDTGPFPEWLR